MTAVKRKQLSPEELAEINKKRQQELRTVEVMMEIYCHGKHHVKHGLCPECQELLEYARKRVQFCPRMQEKTFCSVCPTHCYARDKQERIKEVMRYSGPRMLLHDPVAALRHMYISWCFKRAQKVT